MKDLPWLLMRARCNAVTSWVFQTAVTFLAIYVELYEKVHRQQMYVHYAQKSTYCIYYNNKNLKHRTLIVPFFMKDTTATVIWISLGFFSGDEDME